MLKKNLKGEYFIDTWSRTFHRLISQPCKRCHCNQGETAVNMLEKNINIQEKIGFSELKKR